jgi:hypothetical protein
MMFVTTLFNYVRDDRDERESNASPSVCIQVPILTHITWLIFATNVAK